jgi:hypothetical protein
MTQVAKNPVGDKKRESKFFRNIIELQPWDKVEDLPNHVHGIYALYKRNKAGTKTRLVYVGMARGEKSGIKGRLRWHIKNKAKEWSHFSAFEFVEAHRELIVELEALFLYLYAKDKNVNSLNVVRKSKIFRSVSRKSFADWRLPSSPEFASPETSLENAVF